MTVARVLSVTPGFVNMPMESMRRRTRGLKGSSSSPSPNLHWRSHSRNGSSPAVLGKVKETRRSASLFALLIKKGPVLTASPSTPRVTHGPLFDKAGE